ncbi:MAG TPA: amidohydrolase family protein [Conexibacter sp.]|nr:amidohydrolase family protein [Conexibacter sp.]
MTRVIIEAHAHIIDGPEPVWAWGPDFPAERLLATMDEDHDVMGHRAHVDKAIVMSLPGQTSFGQSLIEAHEYTVASVKKYPDRLYLNPFINPWVHVPDELDILQTWKDEANLCMLKLHPTMHNYLLPLYSPYPGDQSRRMVYPVFEWARTLGVPVLIHMGEPPYSLPSQVVPVAEAFPDVPLIIAHAGAASESCFTGDAVHVARMHDNVYLETSWVQPLELQQAYYAVGASKLIWGSDFAPLSLGPQLRTVVNLHLPPPLGVGLGEDDVYKILGGNIAELCGIPVGAPAATRA